MKITIFSSLAIFMIVLIPSAFAEETEEKFEIEFDEGDYKLEYNNIILPIKLHVSNHDYKITPEYFVRSQGKTITHYEWPNVNSGDFITYLLLDENWSSGTYQIVLKYDEKYFKPLTFKLTKLSDVDDGQTVRAEVGIEKEEIKIETYIKINSEKITIPDKPPSWFSYNQLELPLEGTILTKGTGALLNMFIYDPDNKETLYRMRVLEDGTFQSGIMLDSTWKSGTYKISAELYGEKIASTEFVIDNPRIKPNQVDTKQETVYKTSILLSSQSAGEFEVLSVSGTTDAPSEKLTVIITKQDKSVEEFSASVTSGSYSTNIVLSSGYSVWESGKYLVDVTLDDQVLSSTKFEINKFGNAVFPKAIGSMISGSSGELEKVVEFDVQEHETDTFTISGNVENYKTATKIGLSIVKPDKTKQAITTFANSEGEYSIPIVLDETWPKGEYTIYTTYRDFVDTPVTFTITGKVADVIIDETTKEVVTKQEVEIIPQTIPLPRIGGHTDFAVEGNIGIDMIKDFGKRFGKIPILMTMPDKTTKQLLIRANEEGDFVVNTSITNKWKEGDYSFSVKKDGAMTKFAMITIIDENPNEKKDEIITIKSAMPGSAYAPVDSFELRNDKVEYHLRSNHITFFGTVADDDLGKVTVTIIKYDGSTVKLYPKTLRDNSFSGTANIDDQWPPGSYEIIAKQGNHEIGHTEFLITTTEQIPVYLDDKAIISEDMFLHSKGVELSIKGKPLSIEKIKINLEGPDGSVKQLIQSSTTPVSNGGQIVFTDFTKRISVDKDWVAGTYKATAIQDNSNLGTALIQITPFSPLWLQDQTKLWLDDDITDWQYKNRLRTIAEHGILTLPDSSDASTDFPGWLKLSAEMYVNEETPQSAYLNSLQYLVDSGLLNASK